MKKTIFLLIVAVFSLLTLKLTAQEYTLNMSKGKLILNEVNRVEIIGTTGSQVIISTEAKDENKDERANGLREISASGLSDNTGLGLSVDQNGSTAKVNQVGRNNRNYLVKVPKGVSVYYEHSSWEGKTLSIRDLHSEIEVSANYNSIELENVTGPMAINTVYGQIDATFEKAPEADAVSLHSVYGNVDVSLPANTRADLTLSTSYGKIFTDLDVEMKKEEGGLREISSSKISGTINGGGMDMRLKSTYKNIYLRKN
jgi:DUF4097 and DUF4098 domain-containing protein YvlB